MTSGPQTRYRVRGGNPLQGTVFVQGAKNAALKMIAASLLAAKGRTVLRNVPVIEDVRRAVELAQAVGAVCKFHEAERTLVVDASELTSSVLPEEIARRFRGVGPVRARAAAPARRGDHRGDRRLQPRQPQPGLPLPRLRPARRHRGRGRDADPRQGGPARGAHLYLDTPSHTGTENLIMAASLAPGTTIIDNTALEPEVLDVIAFLTKMGARISGGGTGFVTVEGVERAHRRRAHGHGRPHRRCRVRDGGRDHRRRAEPGRRVARPLRRRPLEARADGRRVRHPRRGRPGSPGPAAAPDQRDHQPVPRLRHRPAVADHGA